MPTQTRNRSRLNNPLTAALLTCLVSAALSLAAFAQAVTTTTVQGTITNAQGRPVSGTVQISWPAFTTNAAQPIAAGKLNVPIGADGFLSVNLAPNAGAQPAGLYYTAIYHLNDGTTNTEYWTVPAAPSATVAQIRAQVMPAAQAVQAASKTYVDTLVQSIAHGTLGSNGGALTGPLYLNGDPTAPTQASTKHYVDTQFSQALPLSGGTATGPITATRIGSAYQVDQFPGSDFGAKLQSCLNQLNPATGGSCDARNFPATVSLASNLTISTPNASIYLPCATITTSAQVIIPTGTRNVAIHGCAYQGGSTANGTAGGTVWVYTGSASAFQIGDPSGSANTPGFWMHDLNLNTANAATTAIGIAVTRAQEIRLDGLYLNGNNSTGQTGVSLDGTGNYAGGTFVDVYINGFGTGWLLTGDDAGNYANASTFLKTHVVCPTANGNPIPGTTGIKLLEGDGNTFSGGDVESCDVMFRLGPSAINNTIVGLRNENSRTQYQADAGSAFNSVLTGGTLYTGQLVDNGSRNSFSDAFHRTANGIKGDWYASQQDGTVTNHRRLGTGQGNERGMLNEVQTDYGNRWLEGYSDAMGTGYQLYQLQDMVNNVNRLAIGQYLSPTANTVTNVVLNNGGCYSSSTPPTVTISGGGGTGATGTAVMTTTASPSCNNGAGFQVGSVTMTSGGSGYTSVPTVTFAGANQVKAPNPVAEIVTAGGTNNQTVINAAGSGAIVLNGSNNAGTGGLVLGSGGASNTTVATISGTGNAQFVGTLQVGGASLSAGTMSVRNNADAEVDYYLQPGATTTQKGSFVYKDFNGASQWYMVKDQNNNWALNSAVGGLDSFKAYQSTNSGDTYINASNASGHIRLNYEPGSGTQTDIYSSGTLAASFLGPTAIKFPGLASTGAGSHNCLQVDSSGYLTNTGTSCAGIPGISSDGSNGINVTGAVTASTLTVGSSDGEQGQQTLPEGTVSGKHFFSQMGEYDPSVFGADPTGATCSEAAIQAALNQAYMRQVALQPRTVRSGIIHFMPGHYKLCGSIMMPYGTELKGTDIEDISNNESTVLSISGDFPAIVGYPGSNGSNTPFNIAGSLTSGAFRYLETVTQDSTGATGVYLANYANGNAYALGLAVGTGSGTAPAGADATHPWRGTGMSGSFTAWAVASNVAILTGHFPFQATVYQKSITLSGFGSSGLASKTCTVSGFTENTITCTVSGVSDGSGSDAGTATWAGSGAVFTPTAAPAAMPLMDRANIIDGIKFIGDSNLSHALNGCYVTNHSAAAFVSQQGLNVYNSTCRNYGGFGFYFNGALYVTMRTVGIFGYSTGTPAQVPAGNGLTLLTYGFSQAFAEANLFENLDFGTAGQKCIELYNASGNYFYGNDINDCKENIRIEGSVSLSNWFFGTRSIFNINADGDKQIGIHIVDGIDSEFYGTVFNFNNTSTDSSQHMIQADVGRAHFYGGNMSGTMPSAISVTAAYPSGVSITNMDMLNLHGSTDTLTGARGFSSYTGFSLGPASSPKIVIPRNLYSNPGADPTTLYTGNVNTSTAVVLNSNPSLAGATFTSGTSSPSNVGSVSTSGVATFNSVVTTRAAPASATDTCTRGTIWSDAEYIYVCAAANTIKRAALTSF